MTKRDSENFDVSTAECPYIYAWKNNEVRAAMFRRPCRVVARGSLGSVLIEFEDGRRTVTSRRALRKRSEEREPAGSRL